MVSRSAPTSRRPDSAGDSRAAGVGLPVLAAGPRPAAQTSRGGARKALAKPPVVAFVSLGCAKNLVDSEKMLGQLAESGAILSGDEAAADMVVVNTCGFLEASRVEALDIIRELAMRKNAGQLKRIVVGGVMTCT